ncbi:DUF6264 family protein [uncultured Microbacterium sp.]|uniref:DUF6264 family protein n=1 Tax=uncultured Microbacterium sp. TaxID=191216 RepID=UPI002629EA53|nr:DUF6264 family protein [uncultured Microbacterium sp.]
MSMDRPQYGEYATPEEQRARAGLPPIEAEPVVPAPAPPQPVTPQSAAPARPSAGRLITLVLLGVGLFNVLSAIPNFLNLSETLQLSLKMFGSDAEFTNYAAAKNWGVIALVVLMAGYAATIWFSVRRMRAARSSWWVPLVGFVVTMFAVSLCMSVPMMGDPAFTELFQAPPAG